MVQVARGSCGVESGEEGCVMECRVGAEVEWGWGGGLGGVASWPAETPTEGGLLS